jgi:ribonuclease HI
VPGVYTDWPTAQAQISGFRNPRHKKFSTRAEAEAFVAEGKRKSAYDVGTGISPEEEIRRLITKGSVPGLLAKDPSSKEKSGQLSDLGTGPLPAGAEDGYDPNIKLDADGTIRERTVEEKITTKKIPRETSPPGMLKIYTDGSSLKNGQIGARAGVGVYFGPASFEYDSLSSQSRADEIPLYTVDWQARGAPSTKKRRKLTWRYRNISEALKGTKQTNQRAELTAIQRALEIAPSHRDVTIFTDSRYSIDCVTNWYKNWQSNGWVNSKGKPVENRDVVQEIREKIHDRDECGKQTLFVWVKGHSTEKGNIEADRLAVEGARKSLMADAMSQSDTGSDEEDEDDGQEDLSDDIKDEDMDDADPEVAQSLKLRKEALGINGLIEAHNTPS